MCFSQGTTNGQEQQLRRHILENKLNFCTFIGYLQVKAKISSNILSNIINVRHFIPVTSV